MSIEGLSVRHARFGAGKVIRADGGYMEVLFEAPASKKAFVYPDAFEYFLEIEGGMQPEIKEALDALHEKQRLQREKITSRIQEQTALRRQALLTERKTAVKRAPRAKKAVK